jgi:hypothetical protein
MRGYCRRYGELASLATAKRRRNGRQLDTPGQYGQNKTIYRKLVGWDSFRR